jgi:DNA-directed RNA polymerase specialized sigma24 family protein
VLSCAAAAWRFGLWTGDLFGVRCLSGVPPEALFGRGVSALVAPDKTYIDSFTEFVRDVESRLQRSLIARYGSDLGRETTAEALAYAWEHWDRVRLMGNPAGYLYRVATSRARRFRPPLAVMPDVRTAEWPWVEPGLPKALGRLSPNQRTVVLLVHSFGYTHAEAGRILGVTTGTVRKHLERGMAKLRSDLEVDR